MIRSASASSSAAYALARSAVLRGGHQLQRPVRGRRGAGDLAVGERPCRGQCGVPRPRPGRSPGASTAELAGHDLAGPVQRAFQEVRAVEQRVGQCRARTRLGAVRASGSGSAEFSMITCDRAVGPDQVGQQVRPTPAGDQAEEAFGQRDPGGGRWTPSGSAQCSVDLQPTAERHAVDEREGRHRARRAACRRPRGRSGRWPGACSRSVILAIAVRSAPAARMNGLPVIGDRRDVVPGQGGVERGVRARRVRAAPGCWAGSGPDRCPG